jgi:hypothetical protein
MPKAVETTEEVTKTDAPVDAFDVELPEDMDAEQFERSIQPPVDEKPEEKKVVAKPAEKASVVTATTAAPEVATSVAAAPVKGSTGKALAAERAKSKDLRAENKRLREKWAEIESERTVGMKSMQGALPPLQVRVDKSKPDDIVRAAVEAEARGESVHPKVIEGVLNAVDMAAQKATEKLVEKLDERRIQQQERELAEDLSEDSGENLTEILTKAGIYTAIARDTQGNYADPVIAKRIYGSANPAKAALRIARAKIASMEPEAEEVEEPLKPEAVVKTPAAKPAETEIEAARREGAKEVVETVVNAAAKPRGVRVFQSAGASNPQVGKSPEFWDSLNRMMDTNPEKFVDFMDKNPAISSWFDRGKPKA